MSLIVVRATYDSEAHVWWTASSDLPGLCLEAASLEELRKKIPGAVADLLEVAGEAGAPREIAVEVVTHAAAILRNAPNIEPPPLVAPARAPGEKPVAENTAQPESAESIKIEPKAAIPEPEMARPRYRFVLLAASLAVAAVLGSLATTGLTRLMAENAPAYDAAASRALKGTIAQLGAELASLKASVEAVKATGTTQYAQLTERFERIERGQAEPAAKLAKIAEQVDRIEQGQAEPATKLAKIAEQLDRLARSPPGPGTQGDVIGLNGETHPAAPAKPAAPAEAKPAKPAILDGWILLGVYRGRALVESRHGEFEVIAGSRLPGLGEVQGVVRQDGRWVVVTPKGLITSVR